MADSGTKDATDFSPKVTKKIDSKSPKTSQAEEEMTGHSKSINDQTKSSSNASLSASPKVAAKRLDLRLTPLLHRKAASPSLSRHKIKRTKSADKFSASSKKVSSIVNMVDSV